MAIQLFTANMKLAMLTARIDAIARRLLYTFNTPSSLTRPIYTGRGAWRPAPPFLDGATFSATFWGLSGVIQRRKSLIYMGWRIWVQLPPPPPN